jgi:hypothetical protein
MHWNRLEGNWKQFKDNVKERWGKLTFDDLNVIGGRREQQASCSSATATPGIRPAKARTTGSSQDATAIERRLQPDSYNLVRSFDGVAADRQARRGGTKGLGRDVVDNVVAASKKLSASINDISQRSAHGAGIASCAIDRRHSAGPCQIGMADRRGRRPDQTIAAQTNLRRSTPASRRPARARRTRLCCRRLRGEVAGEPDRQGRRRDFRADRRH